MNKKTNINIRINTEERDQIRLEAAKTSRTVSNWVVFVIRKYLSADKV